MSNDTEWAAHAARSKERLSQPVHEIFSENTYRIRRNLMAFSVLSLFYALGSTGINSEASSFLGVRFNGIDNKTINWSLVIFTTYLLLHFSWSALDDFSKWLLQLTGAKATKVSEVGGFFDGENSPGGDDQHQLTLSSWWAENIHKMQDNFNRLNNESLPSLFNTQPSHGTHDAYKRADEVLGSIKSQINSYNSNSAYIYVVLNKYDKEFKNLDTSQRFRWRVFETYVPVALSTIAIVALFHNPI